MSGHREARTIKASNCNTRRIGPMIRVKAAARPPGEVCIGAEAMIKIKHVMDAVETDDGQRIWVESYGLTRDLQQWCGVTHVLSHLGPPAALRDWFDEHCNGCGDGYDFFRARYHEFLGKGPYKAAL